MFITALAVILCLSLLAGWTVLFNPVFPLEPGWWGSRLASIAGKAVIASVFLSLYLLFFRIWRKPGNRLFSFILPLIASFVILQAGVTIVYGPPGSPLPVEYSAPRPFIPGLIHQTDAGLLYLDEVDRTGELTAVDGLKNIVLYTQRDLRHLSRASLVARDTAALKSTVVLPAGDSGDPVIIHPANPVYQPIFEAPGFLVSLAQDIASLEGYLLERRKASPGSFSLALFSVLFAATGCLFFSRMSRWPLFNGILTLMVLRGFFFIVRFLQSDIGMEISNMISNRTIAEMLFTLVFLCFGVLLAAMNLAFPVKRHG